MKRSYFRCTTRVFVAFAFFFPISVICFSQNTLLGASPSTSKTAIVLSSNSAAQPLVNFRGSKKVRVTYVGSPDLVATLQSGAKPTALAAADFDADGAMDIVLAYDTPQGGMVAMLPGNPDAYAPKNLSLYKAAAEGKVPATFLPTARLFAVPVSPDFLATGDFDGDGSKDLLVAAKGGNLYFLRGDGHGNLLAPVLVSLPGFVTALAVNDGGHVAVGISGGSVPGVLIFDPGSTGFSSPAATYPVTASVSSIAWGNLGSGTKTDLAVAAGKDLVFIYNAAYNVTSDSQSRPPTTETVPVSFLIQAVTTGDFIWDRESRTEVAVLGDDGAIRIVQHGDLDTRPFNAADSPTRRALLYSAASRPSPDPLAMGPWTIAKQLPAFFPSVSRLAMPMLQSPRLASGPTHDLMTVNAAQNQLTILDTSGATANSQAALPFSSTPVAALALPQKLNGTRDLVVLLSGQRDAVIIDGTVAQTITVTTAVDSDSQNACGNSGILPGNLSGPNISLREASCAANNYGNSGPVTINVPAGTYTLTSLDTGEVQLGKVSGASISVIGTGTAANTIIHQGDGVDRVFNCDPPGGGGVTTVISNITISGGADNDPSSEQNLGGAGVIAGGPGDSATYTNVVVTSNTSAAGSAGGGGLIMSGGGTLIITGSTISGNTAAQAGGGVFFNPGGSAAGDLTVTNSIITGNTVNSGTLEGGGLAALVAPGSSGTISGSTFTSNTAGTGDGGGIYDGGPLTVSNSRIALNTAAGGGKGIYASGASAVVVGIENWWGCNLGPGQTGCDTEAGVSGGSVSFNPWLKLAISASPTTVVPTTGTSTLTADLTHNSNNAAGFSIPNGTTISFGGTLGNDSPATNTTTSGQTTSIYTAGATPGAGTGTATLDNQTVSVNITITSLGPTFTSANNTTFKVGTVGTFSVTTSGSPAPALTKTGTLPSGVTFVDNNDGTATLSGTPGAGTGGTYSLIITATNTGGSTPQSFTLTVNQAPAITSAGSTSFAVGAAGTFGVTTTGFPVNAAITKTGSLPAGVTFVDNGGGTATLAGTPAAATGGSYPITITANNGVTPNATQSFILTVNQAPAITSAGSATFIVGTPGTFSVTTTGFPTNATITENGVLPSGLTLTSNGNGTATLAGTPAATGGSYSITITANNGVAPNGTQAFTLTINQAAAITSANSTGFIVGTAKTFSITTSGFPAVTTIIKSGSLPTGVTFTDNGNGTASLSGTATVSGVYPLTLTAHNGVGTDAVQSFTLTSGQTPAFTSASATAFTAGTAGSFSITTLGFPAPSLVKTAAALPGGVIFSDNGNGTATLAGTPAAGSGGTYNLTFTASNGVGTNATQNFTLTVDQSAAITSANHATFTLGISSAFGVTATGFPVPSLVVTGATLPTGVTFSDNGNGTATFSGTPAAGTSGNYALTLTAHNGIGANSVQSFTLTIGQAPIFNSVGNVTFNAGTAGTYTVTATGFPVPAFTLTAGTLPTGLTFVDNGNGSATLSGTPTAGGLSNLTFTATNSGGASSQSFTLTVNQSPSFVSANSLTLQVGAAGALTITAQGYPVPGIVETGTLPSGMTFVDHGSSTGTLAGTPTQAGIFPIHFTATNSMGTVVQNFTLTVTQTVTASVTTLTSTLNPSSIDQTVIFTATVSGSSGTPTGTATFMDGTSTLGAITLNGSGIAAISTASLAVGTHSVTAIYSGDSTFLASTSTAVSQSVLATADFTVSANPPTEAAPAGTPATFTITGQASSGFTDPVTLACGSGLPAHATCRFSPTTIVPGSTTGSTLTITTVAATAQLISPQDNFHPRGPVYALWYTFPTMLLGGCWLVAPKRHKAVRSGLVLLVVTLCLLLACCAWNNSFAAMKATPPGSYTVMVTGTDAHGLTQTTTSITLTVE